MAQAGDAFHRFVANIEEVIKKNQFFKIKSHVKIPDKITGELREHDIILEYDDGNHSFQIAIECKDWKKKVDAPVIEGFITKLNDTGINKGIVVSSNGFSSGAISKAKGYNVECWTLTEAEIFDWCGMKTLEQYQNIPVSCAIKVKLREGKTEETLTLYRHIPEDHEIDLGKFVRSVFSQRLWPIAEEENSVKIEINNFSEFYVVTETGKRFDLEGIILNVTYKTERKLIPFLFHEYADISKSKLKKQIASAPIQLGKGMTAKLVISMGEGGGNVSMIFEKED